MQRRAKAAGPSNRTASLAHCGVDVAPAIAVAGRSERMEMTQPGSAMLYRQVRRTQMQPNGWSLTEMLRALLKDGHGRRLMLDGLVSMADASPKVRFPQLGAWAAAEGVAGGNHPTAVMGIGCQPLLFDETSRR